MKSVAVVGAGPGGLVAAVKLLRSLQFCVTIFEKSSDIGGLWSEEGLINPEMQTNLNKFTVCFSDQSWDSVDLGRGKQVSLYPKAWQVYRYLKHYVDKFIPLELIHFNTKVVSIEREIHEHDQTAKWKVLTTRTHGLVEGTSEAIFDYIVIAPGFSSHPSMPELKIDKDLSLSKVPKVIHSTQFRNLVDILPDPAIEGDKKKKVLIVGGSHSGSEAATSLALQLSNARYAPLGSQDRPYANTDCEIVHLTSHRMYALPALVRNEASKTCAFHPFDFKLYNRSTRPEYPAPSFTVGLVNSQKLEAGKKFIKTLLEGVSELSKNETQDELPHYVVISEAYNEFVRSKQIQTMLGSLKGLSRTTESGLLCATIQTSGTDDQEIELNDVAAVVCATGFDIVPTLDFISADVKTLLGFQNSCSRVPLLLDSAYLSANNSLPELAVMGYFGSYWGFLEMQARATVARWTTTYEKLGESEALSTYFKDLRTALQEGRRNEVPQNPFNDYVGFMEQAAEQLGLEKVNLDWKSTEGPLCPARFVDAGLSNIEAVKTMEDLQTVERASASAGLFTARAVFHSLLGKWVGKSDDGQGCEQSIQLNFHPRFPTAESFGWEYLAIQRSDTGEVRMVYRYDEAKDEITVWAVDQEDDLRTGHLICSFQFLRRDTGDNQDTIIAEQVYVDTTRIAYTPDTFTFSGAQLQTFAMLVGPKHKQFAIYTFRR